jgi:CheY-like chemotaxis protein/HPt (histidine-containing phosphotransfer) domain-containing protein
MLAKFAIAPDVAGNGLEAIEAARRNDYDVILMDVHMPEMGGLEATRAIRLLPGKAATVPIIALTANAFASDIEACRAAGMNGHVGKPFRREELLIAIAEAVTGKSEPARKPALAAPVPVDAPAIDWSVIERFRADSDDETLRLLIDTFLVDAAEKLEQLVALSEKTNVTEEAVRLAHSLKSASAMAGAMALSQLAADVESRLAQDGVPPSVQDGFRMKSRFADYRAQLEAKGLAANG